MRKTIIILSLIVMTACQNQKRDSRIEKFENFLGKYNSELLSTKVDSFEKFLKINFKDLNLEEAYFEYLNIIESGEFEKTDWKYEGTGYAEINELIERSGFRKEVWLRPDTVWIENGDLHFEYVYIDKKDTSIIKGNSLSPKYDLIENQDSIINIEKQLTTFNINGRFMRGLEMIKDSDSTLISYIEDKQIMRDIAPSIIAGRLIFYKADFSDYFIKRIIAIELY
jgi:major membrane immunogen (membrane-anchored lipoprotein)